jgi:membrane fusion protein (multidrug efflux system)
MERKMNFKTFLIFSILLSLFIFCGKKDEAQNQKTTTKTETPDQKSGQSIAVEVLVVKPRNIEQNILLTGVLKPLHSVDIVSEVSGKVQKIYKKLGDSITQRDTLAIINDKVPLSNYRQAKSQLLSAENNLKIAELNLKSDEELFKNGDISKLAFESSQLAVKSAEANRLSALASLSLLEKNYKDTRIMSPISGLISRKFIELGTMVTPNMPLYRVVDLKTLKIEVGVSQSMIVA